MAIVQYKSKTVKYNAVQFDGTNFAEIQAFVGNRWMDLEQTYKVPRFDVGSRWLGPNVATAVLYVFGGYQPVNVGDWIMDQKGPNTDFLIISNTDLQANYVVAP